MSSHSLKAGPPVVQHSSQDCTPFVVGFPQDTQSYHSGSFRLGLAVHLAFDFPYGVPIAVAKQAANALVAFRLVVDTVVVPPYSPDSLEVVVQVAFDFPCLPFVVVGIGLVKLHDAG